MAVRAGGSGVALRFVGCRLKRLGGRPPAWRVPEGAGSPVRSRCSGSWARLAGYCELQPPVPTQSPHPSVL